MKMSKMVEAGVVSKAEAKMVKTVSKAAEKAKPKAKSGKPVPAPKKVVEKAAKPSKSEKLLAIYSDCQPIKKAESLEKLVGPVTKISTRDSFFTRNDDTKEFESLIRKITDHISEGGPAFRLDPAALCAVMDGKPFFISGKQAFPA